MTAVESSGTRIEVHSPIDGHVIGEVDEVDRAGVIAVADGLRAAQPAWERLGISERVAWLGKYRDWLLDNKNQLTSRVRAETGKPSAEAPLEVFLPLDLINYYSAKTNELLATSGRRPHGLLTATKRLRVAYRPYPLVGVITPWNFPLALSLADAVPALIAGAAVMLKPSELTPCAVEFAVDGWRKIGAPPVFACVQGAGRTGEAIVDAVDYVQFTGSTKTGRAIATQAASRLIPYSLELGGKDPAIVLADADLEFTAAGIAFGALTNSGQMCTSIERVYVEESAFGPLVDRLAETVRGLRQNCDDGYATDICTLTTAAQLENVKRHVADAVSKGARIILGGNPTGNGFGYEPTILVNVNHTMDVMREESFGPLLPVMSVVNADEAIELANDSPYGLAASIWSGDRKRAEALALQLEAGSVDINDSSAHLLCFPLPQSGWKQSGIGTRFGGEHGIHKYCRTQGIVSPRVEASFIAKLLWFPYSAGKAQLVDRVFRLLSARDLRRRLGFRGKN